MAFRNLIEADCGQANSLVKITSHFTKDQAKSDELRQSFQAPIFSTNQNATFQTPDQLVQEFLQETMVVPQTFHMDSLLQEMREIENQSQILPPIVAPTVRETLNISNNPEETENWSNQYLQDNQENLSDNEHIWNYYQDDSEEKSELGFGPNWADDYLSREETKKDTVEEKEDADKSLQDTANELLSQVDQDPKFAYSKFMKFMKQIGEGELGIEKGQVVENIQQKETADSWTEQYLESPPIQLNEQGDQDENYDAQFWQNLQSEWMKITEDQEGPHPWLNEFVDFYDTFKDYSFIETNPMLDTENPLELGKQKLEQGDLPTAVLCFEAAVQKEPNNSEAWQLLGVTQAENEQDPAAIAALKHCISIDPTDLKALMSLAVSYTNESYQNQACNTLIQWLKHNPKYCDLVPPDLTTNIDNITSLISDRQKRVQDIFIKAVHKNPQQVDHEIQSCLGVLFYLSGDYDKSIDCFETALKVKPDDSRLWNRLGATLANGNRPEKAIEAYHRALALAPGFIRARYNVGITCINLGAHREAAEHLLTALNLQAKGELPTSKVNMNSAQMSETIWSTLQMCVNLMDRFDLRPLVENRDLTKLNEVFNINE